MSERVLASHLARLAGVPLTEILAAVSEGRLDAQRAGSLVMVERSSAARWLATLARNG